MKILSYIQNGGRPLVMILAMCIGVLCHSPLAMLDRATSSLLAPALIFGMLFVTFCKVRLSDMNISKLHIILLAFQSLASIAVYHTLCPLFGETLAQGGMICFLAPIAMGAVVIGGVLGANVASIASYSLLCNFTIAAIAPYILARYGNGECTFSEIMSRIVPLLILPFVMAQILRALWSRASSWISAHGEISFYMWMISMSITLGRTTTFIIENSAETTLSTQFGLAAIALLACLVQFALGRLIGGQFGEGITAGQSLGQKNTVLAVWLAHSFLNPISSIAPTAYIIWQNLVNSIQIFLHDRKSKKKVQEI